MTDDSSLHEPTPAEVRATIDATPQKIEIPFMSHTWNTDTKLIKSLNAFLYLTGCRVSEAVTKQTKGDRCTGNELVFSIQETEGEEAAVWNFDTLKRKTGLRRNVALPLNQRYEPWTRRLAEDWENGNPYNISRGAAYQINRVIFSGIGYVVEPQLIRVKNQTIFEAPRHMKPAGNHWLRHIRARELTVYYKFNDNDLMTYFGWSPITFSKNPYMQRYQNLRWQDYYPKLLKPFNPEK